TSLKIWRFSAPCRKSLSATLSCFSTTFRWNGHWDDHDSSRAFSLPCALLYNAGWRIVRRCSRAAPHSLRHFSFHLPFAGLGRHGRRIVCQEGLEVRDRKSV